MEKVKISFSASLLRGEVEEHETLTAEVGHNDFERLPTSTNLADKNNVAESNKIKKVILFISLNIILFNLFCYFQYWGYFVCWLRQCNHKTLCCLVSLQPAIA